MVDREIDWEYLVLAFFATAIIMSGIFYAGMQLDQHKVDSLRNDVRQVEVEQRSHMLGLKLAESVEGQKCEAMKSWMNSTVPEIRDLRKKVAAYESSSKIQNSDYRLIKKRYMNLVVQNLIEVRHMEETCGDEVVNIIYLYTKDDCGRCQDQGTVLTYYRRNYQEDVIVHPLDTDLDMKSINFLQKFYGVERYPSLIIEGEVYEGYQSREQLGEIIRTELNRTGNESGVSGR